MVVSAGTVTEAPSIVSVISAMEDPVDAWSGGGIELGNITGISDHSKSYVGFPNISGHNFIALNIAVGAVWPRPHRDASIIVWPISNKRSRSPVSSSAAAFRSRISYCRRVPNWHG